MSIWWSLRLRREAASVPLARRLLLSAMDAAGVDSEISYELAIALSEACANAVEHGTGERSDAYLVTACIDNDTCHIEVTDTGPGFPDVPQSCFPPPGLAPGASASGPSASGPSAHGSPVPGSPVSGPPARDAPASRPAGSGTPATGRPAVGTPATAAGQDGPPHGSSTAPGPASPLPELRQPEAEHGRGLRLIEALADHVSFANRSDQGGAVVSFDKLLKWRDDALLRAG